MVGCRNVHRSLRLCKIGQTTRSIMFITTMSTYQTILGLFLSSLSKLNPPDIKLDSLKALSAAAGPLMRNFPEKAIDLLHVLLPGIGNPSLGYYIYIIVYIHIEHSENCSRFLK